MSATDKALADFIAATTAQSERQAAQNTALVQSQAVLTRSVQQLADKLDLFTSKLEAQTNQQAADIQQVVATATQDRAATSADVQLAIDGIADRTPAAYFKAAKDFAQQPEQVAKVPPTGLPTTNLGPNHADWLIQFASGISLWSSDAFRLLTKENISLYADGSFGIKTNDVPTDKWVNLNKVVWHIIQSHVKGDARRHLDRHMAKYALDDTLTDGGAYDEEQLDVTS